MSYITVTTEQGAAMLETEAGYVLLDVRRTEEFAAGHIPGAVNIPNETIGGSAPAGLPDRHQRIFIYCRSGNRSRQAAAKLAALGYTGIVDFGGILDWKGDVVTEPTGDTV